MKSLGGIRLKSSRVKMKGLEHDRRWMLVDENNKFMTQRMIPAMSLFTPRWMDGSFRISHNGDSIDLMIDHPGIEDLNAIVWDSAVVVREVSQEHSQWFTEKLGVRCKLVKFPEENARPVEAPYERNVVSLADGYPLLLIGQASLDDLNSRLQVPVPMNRFRPNLVVTGGEAFEEDTWKDIVVGSNKFQVTKKCGRCVVTTIDQESGVKGKEPLLTLSRYRKEQDNEIYFGVDVLAVDHNEIREGDEVLV